MGLFKPNVEKMEEKRDVKGLIKALRYEDKDVRGEAAWALGKIGDARAVEPLIQVLNVVNEETAQEALVMIGKPAVEPLIRALKDSSGHVHVRCGAARVLGKMGDVRAVELLVQALKDSSSDVRYGAARVLGKMGDVRAVEPLVQALSDTDGYVLVLIQLDIPKI